MGVQDTPARSAACPPRRQLIKGSPTTIDAELRAHHTPLGVRRRGLRRLKVWREFQFSAPPAKRRMLQIGQNRAQARFAEGGRFAAPILYGPRSRSLRRSVRRGESILGGTAFWARGFPLSEGEHRPSRSYPAPLRWPASAGLSFRNRDRADSSARAPARSGRLRRSTRSRAPAAVGIPRPEQPAGNAVRARLALPLPMCSGPIPSNE